MARYACVLQHDQNDCGAAALATVALQHGRPLALRQIRDLAGTDAVGAHLLGLFRAAEGMGFAARAAKATWASLSKIPLPAVAHVIAPDGRGHFVVLHRVRRESILLANPNCGLEKRTREDFCKTWTGYLLLLTPDDSKAPPAASPFPSPWRRFTSILRGHAPLLLEALFCALAMTGLGLLTSYFVQHLVDSILVRGETRLLNALALGMLGVAAFRALFAALRQFLLIHIGRNVDLGLLAGYGRHLLRLPISFFVMRRVGDILSRVHDAIKIREAVAGAVLTGVLDGTLVLLTGAALFYYDPKLGALACAFLPVFVVVNLLHLSSLRRRSLETMEKSGTLHAHLVENVVGVETVKAFQLERSRAEAGEEALAHVVQSQFSLQKIGIRLESLGLLLHGAIGILVLWYGGHRVVDGALSLGQLMFCYTLLGTMLGSMERLPSMHRQIQDALSAIDRLYEVLDLEPEESDETPKAEFRTLKDAIEFRNVGFQYPGRSKFLEGIDLRIPAGSTVALVGESGSGKTTILRLLLQLHTPTEGQILLDGVDARDFSKASLRSRIGFVSQEPFVFNGTLRENIALGRRDAGLDEIAAAAKAAGL